MDKELFIRLAMEQGGMSLAEANALAEAEMVFGNTIK